MVNFSRSTSGLIFLGLQEWSCLNVLMTMTCKGLKEINAKIGTLLGYVVVFSIHIHYSFSYEARLCFAGLDRVHIALSC